MARAEQLKAWVAKELGMDQVELEVASSDASFRQYFRVHHQGKSYIIMDAPPSHEDVKPFLHVAELFRDSGLNVPEIYARNIEEGFLLIGDLGSRDYLSVLNSETVDSLYGDALSALLEMQQHCPVESDLPPYDRGMLLREMELFREWLLGQELKITLNVETQMMLDDLFALLADSALEQPAVCVHRDYHSRNLMVLEESNPGVVDFQDAVIGPVTYDLVSLLRDCYISWPAEQVYQWVEHYRQHAEEKGICKADHAQFVRWFDLMGVQRHLKASGIFARLNIRDGKPGYLQDIPRTLNYIVDVAEKYDELEDFGRFLSARVLPALNKG